MEQPKFSVVIPLFNKAQSISRTLDSLSAQTFQDFDVTIVDDGSTDESVNVITPRLNDKIRLISQENGGVSSARNAGLKTAKSSYAAFLDADDLWMPEFLETLDKLIRLYPGAGIYATSYVLSDGVALRLPQVAQSVEGLKPGLIENYFHAAAFGDPPFFTSSLCVDREIALGLGGFKLGVRHGEDLDLWARIALKNKVVFMNEAKAIYRTEAENRTSHHMPALKPWSFRADFEKELAKGTLAADQIEPIKEYCARIALYHARGNFLNPDRKALRKFIHGIETNFFSRKKKGYLVCGFLPPACLRLLFWLHQKVRQLK